MLTPHLFYTIIHPIQHKAYKFRIYPNAKQKELINKTIGCCRYVFNYFLAHRKEVYEKEGFTVGFNECCLELTKLKKEKKWLKEVPSQALESSLKNLDNAYKNFFKKNTKFPKFKSRRNLIQSYTNRQSIKVTEHYIQLPKLKKIKFDKHRKVDGRIINATVSKTSTNKYFISICCEINIEKLPKSENKIGIDLGIKYFAVLSNGDKIDNPKYFKKYQTKLAKAQRKLSRRKKGGKNREKARLKVALIHEKITNCRKDFLRKLSTKLIRENQTIALEDLNVAGMVRNHKLAKSISDCSWSEFKRQLTYKASWYGREIMFCSRFEPTTQLCSNCGVKNELLKEFKSLNIREWQCECGASHDRDVNAAKNILKTARHAVSLDQYLDQWIRSSQETP